MKHLCWTEPEADTLRGSPPPSTRSVAGTLLLGEEGSGSLSVALRRGAVYFVSWPQVAERVVKIGPVRYALLLCLLCRAEAPLDMRECLAMQVPINLISFPLLASHALLLVAVPAVLVRAPCLVPCSAQMVCTPDAYVQTLVLDLTERAGLDARGGSPRSRIVAPDPMSRPSAFAEKNGGRGAPAKPIVPHGTRVDPIRYSFLHNPKPGRNPEQQRTQVMPPRS